MKYYTIIILFLILIFLLTIYSYFKKENFTDIDVNFINYTDSKLLQSERATYDPDMIQLSTIPNLPIDTKIDNDYSIINKNSIYYLFKKSVCYFKINKTIIKNNSIIIEFNIKTEEDYKNIISFILLNTYYVEFLINNKKTDKYILNLPYFTNINIKDNKYTYIDNNKITLTFNKNNGNTKDDFVSTFNQNDIIFYIYYIDENKNSFQNIGLQLPKQKDYNYLNSKFMLIYDKNYINSNYDEKTYQFMNLFRQLYLSFIVPDLTFSFTIVVNDNFNNNQQLINCAVLNKFYGGKDTNCENNILSCETNVDDKFINIKFTTGDNIDCGYNNSMLIIKVPKPINGFTNGINLNICITVSANSKSGFVKWNDVKSTDVFSSKNVCYGTVENNNQNNYKDIFIKKTFPRYILENTTLTWNNEFILEQPIINFGNVNFLTKYNNL